MRLIIELRNDPYDPFLAGSYPAHFVTLQYAWIITTFPLSRPHTQGVKGTSRNSTITKLPATSKVTSESKHKTVPFTCTVCRVGIRKSVVNLIMPCLQTLKIITSSNSSSSAFHVIITSSSSATRLSLETDNPPRGFFFNPFALSTYRVISICVQQSF